MSELPKGWEVCQLYDLLIAFESGSRPKGGVRGIQSGVPSIGGEHLTYNGIFDFTSIKYVPVEFACKMSKGRIEADDILIVKDGATTGKTAFVGNDFPFKNAVVNEHVFICRPSKLIEPRFLFRYLASKEGQEKILDNFQGTAQGGINQSFSRNTEVFLAPLKEQKRIVAKLESLLGKVEACRGRLEKIPLLLKRFRQSVLAAACSGRLTADWRKENKEYNSWRHSTLQDLLISLQNGISKRFSKAGQETVVVKLADIKDGVIYQDNFRAIKLTADEIEKYRLEQNDILIIRVNGSPQLVGNFILCEDVGIWTYCDHLIRMRVDPFLVLPKYLKYISQTEKVREFISENMVSSAGQNTISQKTISSVPIPLPPLVEQYEIVRRVKRLFALADRIEARYQKAKAQVERLTQSILAKAFCGELVPQDPADEPASALLARLRAEIETQKKDSPANRKKKGLRSKGKAKTV